MLSVLVAQMSPPPNLRGFPRAAVTVTTPYPLPTTYRMQTVPPTPRPIPTATGDPHRFALEVRPQSATRIEVFVNGAFKVPGFTPMEPATPTPTFKGTGLSVFGQRLVPSTRDLPDPALNDVNESYALELRVRDDRGHIVARGVPQKAGYAYGGPTPTLTFQTLTFDLDRPLPPAQNPYKAMVRWRDTPDVSASSAILISPVPISAGTRLGDRFIAPPYAPDDVFRLSAGAAAQNGQRRNFVSEVDPQTTRSITENEDARGFGPIVSDSSIDALRVKFLDVPVYAKNFAFNCVDAHDRGAVAALIVGRAMHIDTIARIGHVMSWLPDDARQSVYSYPCNGDCSKNHGAFVDSPLVVGFKIDAEDTNIIPQVQRRPSAFDGRCVRGYTVLQNEKQFTRIFSLEKE